MTRDRGDRLELITVEIIFVCTSNLSLSGNRCTSVTRAKAQPVCQASDQIGYILC